MAKLHEFLQFGLLNRVGFGSPAQHIRRVVGAYPDIRYENNNKSRKPCIYKYNGLQFLFHYNEDNQRSEVECMIFKFNFGPAIFPRIVLPNDWFPNRQTTEKQFHNYIVKHGLSWKVWADYGDWICFLVGKSHVAFQKTHQGYRMDVLSAYMLGYPEPTEIKKYQPKRSIVTVSHTKKGSNNQCQH